MILSNLATFDPLAHSFCPLWHNRQYPTPTFLVLLWSNSNFRILCNLHMIQLQTCTSIKTPALLSLSWFTCKFTMYNYTTSRKFQAALWSERRPVGHGVHPFISIAQAATRLATLHQTTMRGYQPHLWSVDSSRVELAVRRFCLEDGFFSLYETCYAPAPAMDPAMIVQATTVWAN